MLKRSILVDRRILATDLLLLLLLLTGVLVFVFFIASFTICLGWVYGSGTFTVTMKGSAFRLASSSLLDFFCGDDDSDDDAEEGNDDL